MTKTISTLSFGANSTAKTVGMPEIMKLFEAQTLPVQRDHAKRARKAKYLHGQLFGEQMIFNAVYIEELKEVALLDGYTRCECIKLGLSTVVGKLLLIQHRVKTVAEATRLYDLHNNLLPARGLRTVWTKAFASPS